MSKKLKTLKDIYDVSKMSYISDEAQEVVDDLCDVAREWIKVLEEISKDKRSIPTFDVYENGGIGWYVKEYVSEDPQMMAGIIGWIKLFFNLESLDEDEKEI